MKIFLAIFAIFANCTLLNAKVVTVGIDTNYKPFSYIENGKKAGIDIEILQKIEEITDFEFKFQEMDFRSLLIATQTSKIDIVASGLNLTKNRAENNDFSTSYYSSGLSFVCKKGEKFDKNSKIAIEIGSISEDFAIKNKLNTVKFDDLQSVISQIKLNKQIACSLMSEIQANLLSDFEIYSANSELFEYVFMLSRNFAYKTELNKVIQQLKNSGEIEKIIKKYQKNQQFSSDILSMAINISNGILYTIAYAFCAFFIGFIIAIFVTIARFSDVKIVKFTFHAYVSAIRGVPLIVQMTIIYFSLQLLTNSGISVLISGIIAFSINSSAYLSEVFRLAVKAIPQGQFDAAKSMNLSKFLIFKDLILPQGLNNCFNMLVAEIVSLVKESSIISIIGGYDIMKYANIEIYQYYSYFLPLCIASVYYYSICMLIEISGSLLHKKIVKYNI